MLRTLLLPSRHTSMRLKLAIAVFTILGCGSLATGVSRANLRLTPQDYIDAWPATEQFTDGPHERLVAYPAALHGRASARHDISDGRLTVKMWGLPAPWQFAFSEILQTRGVATKTVAGCVVSQPTLAAWKGYNEIMRTEIERRYGKQFLNAAAAQAQEEFERRNSRGELLGEYREGAGPAVSNFDPSVARPPALGVPILVLGGH
jgi:hypothetical protein